MIAKTTLITNPRQLPPISFSLREMPLPGGGSLCIIESIADEIEDAG